MYKSTFSGKIIQKNLLIKKKTHIRCPQCFIRDKVESGKIIKFG